jgi:hypothetical protein
MEIKSPEDDSRVFYSFSSLPGVPAYLPAAQKQSTSAMLCISSRKILKTSIPESRFSDFSGTDPVPLFGMKETLPNLSLVRKSLFEIIISSIFKRIILKSKP